MIWLFSHKWNSSEDHFLIYSQTHQLLWQKLKQRQHFWISCGQRSRRLIQQNKTSPWTSPGSGSGAGVWAQTISQVISAIGVRKPPSTEVSQHLLISYLSIYYLKTPCKTILANVYFKQVFPHGASNRSRCTTCDLHTRVWEPLI